MNVDSSLKTIGGLAGKIDGLIEDIENLVSVSEEEYCYRVNGRRKALRLLKASVKAQKTELDRHRDQVERLTEASLQANAALSRAFITQQINEETIRSLSRQAEQSCDDLVLWKKAPSERCRAKRIQDCHICDRIECGDNIHPAMVEKRRLERLCGQHSEAVNKIGAVLKERDATILDLSGKVNKLCDDRTTLEREKDALKVHIENLVTAVVFDVKPKQEWDVDLKVLRKILEDERSEHSIIVRSMTQERDEAIQRFSQLEERMAHMSRQYALACRHRDEVKEANLSLYKMIEGLAKDRTALEDRATALESEHNILKSTHREVVNKWNEIADKNADLRDEVTRLRTATRCPACQKPLMQGRFMHVEEVIALAEEMTAEKEPK